MSEILNKQWHLAENEDEMLITEFELYLWRVFYGFLRWQEDCENCINSFHLTGEDLAILHIIRMKDRPKTFTEIGRLMNREDYHNIKYSIRKLEKLKLIKSVKSANKKTLEYQATEAGKKDTNAYTKIRREVLIETFKNKGINLAQAIETLNEMKFIYDEASRTASLYRSNPQEQK
jgi:predicted MarR family transcription regulator